MYSVVTTRHSLRRNRLRDSEDEVYGIGFLRVKLSFPSDMSLIQNLHGTSHMIRTFLFDMGNVLTRFSHDTMCDQIGELCGLDGDSTRRLLIDSGLQWEFERGRISEEVFRDQLSALVGREIDLDQLRLASSDIFDPIHEMKPIVQGLKEQGYRLVLLSNTTISHFDWIKSKFDFLVPFDHCVVSYEAGAMKPDPPIYEAALRAIHCEPGEAFYTDDIPEYVEKGREYGFQAEVFTGPEDLLRHLAVRGVNPLRK